MFCGKDIQVRQAIAGAARGNVENWLELAEAADEAGNQDEAYDYYTRVLEVDPKHAKAWFGKAAAAGWSSNLRSGRFSELVVGIERGLEYTPEEERDEARASAAVTIGRICVAYYRISYEHFIEYVALEDSWPEHVLRCEEALAALDIAHEYNPKNKTGFEAAITISKSLIEGIEYEDPYDSSEYGNAIKTYHLPPEDISRIKKRFDSYVEKLKAIDPTYNAPEIEIAGGSGCGLAILGFIIVVGLIGFVIWAMVR